MIFIKYNNKIKDDQCFILKSRITDHLVVMASIIGELHIISAGHHTLPVQNLGIELQQVETEVNKSSSIYQIYSINSSEELINKFAPIFQEKVGYIPKLKITLNISE